MAVEGGEVQLVSYYLKYYLDGEKVQFESERSSVSLGKTHFSNSNNYNKPLCYSEF